jgi:hypothetical protein
MADVGTSSANLVSTQWPNADAMGVDPSLEALAAYLVQGQSAWTTHDGGALNDALQAFWNAKGSIPSDTLAGQSYGSLIGGTVQMDLVALDAYAHRMLGFEYMYQMAYATPTDIPGLLAQEQAQFQLSSTEFNAVGLTMQASHDAKILGQASDWAAQETSVWIDDSYVAAFRDQVNKDLDAAGDLISNVGSALDFLTSTPMLIIGALLAAYLYFERK